MGKFEDFCEEYNITPKTINSTSPLIDPGVKSVNSIISKARRNINNFGVENFTMKGVTDISRCTIIVDSYSQVNSLLHEMALSFETLSGYTSRCANGYRGIHLNFCKDGISTEVQITTPKVFAVGQAAEEIYIKWREFSPKNELNAIKMKEDQLQAMLANGTIVPQVINQLKNEISNDKKLLKQKFKEYEYDYSRCREIQEEALAEANFEDFIGEIESFLQLQTLSVADKDRYAGMSAELGEVLSTKLSKENVCEIDEEKTREVATRLFDLSKSVHKESMDSLKECIEISQEIGHAPTNQEKKVQEVAKIFDQLIKSKVADDKAITENINEINRTKSFFVSAVLKANKNNEIEKMSLQQIIKTYEASDFNMTEKINNAINNCKNTIELSREINAE